MKRKYIDAVDLTALGEGDMVALASTFGKVDQHGDRVIRGAYSTDVAKLKAGASLPLVWGHDVNGSPQNFVGEIHDADETDEGLEVDAHFDLDDPVARKAYRLVKQSAIDKLSIGYRVRRERRANDGVNELLDIELHEVSLVLNPANERARVLAIKDAPAATVASDAALRQQARALGIEPPLTRRQLRRRSDELALEHALGWQPPPQVTPEPAESVHRGAAAPGMGPAQARDADRRPRPRSHRGGTRRPGRPNRRKATRAGQGARPRGPTATPASRLHRREGASQTRNADPLRTSRRPMNMLQGVRTTELLPQPCGLEGLCHRST
jgi:HK97 family phage prohead protease